MNGFVDMLEFFQIEHEQAFKRAIREIVNSEFPLTESAVDYILAYNNLSYETLSNQEKEILAASLYGPDIP